MVSFVIGYLIVRFGFRSRDGVLSWIFLVGLRLFDMGVISF